MSNTEIFLVMIVWVIVFRFGSLWPIKYAVWIVYMITGRSNVVRDQLLREKMISECRLPPDFYKEKTARLNGLDRIFFGSDYVSK